MSSNPSEGGEGMNNGSTVGRSRQGALRQVAELPTLTMLELKERWRLLYGSEPLPYNKLYLVKRLAYRIQELALGGMTAATEQQLDDILADSGYNTLGVHTGTKQQKQFVFKQFAVGTVLRTEWHGEPYEVIVVRNGFEYGGRVYRHLSPIAQLITGSHMSGNAFFGVKSAKKGKA